MHNPFDTLAVALAVAACMLRYLDRNWGANLLSSGSLLAAMLGQ